MKTIICENYEEMSAIAADIFKSQLKEKEDSVLGLATGSTPIGVYQKLADAVKAGEISFNKAKSFNLDEYYPISADDEQSYHYFMEHNLFKKIDIKKENTHILDGMCENAEEECNRFELLIDKEGGIDLQILGIGENGHIGFNEPGDNLKTFTHVTDLTESTVKANARFFDNEDMVPKKAITMGIGTILKAKKIILLASGYSKHNAIMQLLDNNITTDLPASILKVHPDVTIICDREAYASFRIGIDIGGTRVKFGVIDKKGNLEYTSSIETITESAQALVSAISAECKEIMKKYCTSSIGVATAGIFSDGLITASNLPFEKFNLQAALEKEIGLPVKVANDANCAALGEAKTTDEKRYKNILLISLGTGVGGGIIIDGKLYEGKGNAGEIGHFPIELNGKMCSCKRKGCFEQYASANALMAEAKKAAEANKESLLAKNYFENGMQMSGEIFFNAVSNGCTVANTVFNEYICVLVAGLNGLISIFDPDMLVLSGGITNSGEILLNPLKKLITPGVEIKISELKDIAGVIGAASLG